MRKKGRSWSILIGIMVLFLLVFAATRVPRGQETAAMTALDGSATFTYRLIDGNGPQGIWQKTVGDLNGDGLPDLVAGGHDAQELVWYSNPDWTKRTIHSGSPPSTDGEVVDIDGDGDNDLVSLTDNDIRWYKNPGWDLTVIADRTLHDVEVGDFDGDNDIDLVARNQGEFGAQGDTLFFYRQDNPTTWVAHEVSIPDGEGLKAADIDNDGDLDVIIGGRWYENKGSVTGSWPEHTFTTSWTHPNAYVDTGDFNGDGRLDIVLSPAELQGQSYKVSWFEAPADPTAANWTEHIVENNVEAVRHFVGAADMNNDGLVDIASADMQQGSAPQEIVVYLNGGGGTSWTKLVLAESGSHSMRLVDIDNDGDIDLYGANWQGNKVELWENQTCQQSLASWERHVIDPDKPWTSVFVESGDVDKDGLPDIVTGGWWYKNPGTPGGAWERKTIGDPLNNLAALYDFDGDGDLDALGTEGTGANANPAFVWAENNGSGSFTIRDNVDAGDGDFLQGIAVGEFTPGAPLQIALSWHEGGQGIQQLSVGANPTSDPWSHALLNNESQDEQLSAGDIDRDGDLDLLMGTKWLRNNNGTWDEVFDIHDPQGDSPDRNRLADINGDGRLDAVVGYEAISVNGTLAWYEQGATATQSWTEHVIATVVGPMSLDVIDMDYDGDFDVVVGEHNLNDPDSARLLVFENVDGKGGSWTSHLVYTGDEHHDGAQVVDIDNDGDLDIISIGWGHSRVLLYENKGGGCNGQTPTVATPTLSPAGGTYTGSVKVSMTTSTAGAAIRYTLDGKDPTASSALYSQPITVGKSLTVKARGFLDGYNPSGVRSAQYVIQPAPKPTVATPKASPPGGVYSEVLEIVLTTTTAGAAIRYTLDDSEPTQSSTLYTGPIEIASSTLLKARAYKDGYEPSDVVSAGYLIDKEGTGVRRFWMPIVLL